MEHPHVHRSRGVRGGRARQIVALGAGAFLACIGLCALPGCSGEATDGPRAPQVVDGAAPDASDAPPPAADGTDHSWDAVFALLRDGQWAGSGWVATPEGRAITAAHTVAHSNGELTALFPDGSEVAARLARYAPEYDLAVLELAERDEPYPFLEIDGTGALGRGDELRLFAVQVGEFDWELPGRVVDNLEAYEHGTACGHARPVRQVVGSASPGSSGGAWVDARGRVAGVQVASYRRGRIGSPVCSLVPARHVARVLDVPATPTPPTLGGSVRAAWKSSKTPEDGAPRGPEALRVTQLHPRGALFAAGFRVGDYITAVDGRPVGDERELIDLVRGSAPGTELRLTSVPAGGGDTITRRVVLQPIPRELPGDGTSGGSVDDWGVFVVSPGGAHGDVATKGEVLTPKAPGARAEYELRAQGEDATFVTVVCAGGTPVRAVQESLPVGEVQAIRVVLRRPDGNVATSAEVGRGARLDFLAACTPGAVLEVTVIGELDEE